MSAKPSGKKPTETDDSEAKGSKAHEKPDVEQAVPEENSTAAPSASLERQDTLLLFGKVVSRKSLEDKEKDELINIIVDLNKELVRTTSRLGEKGREKVFKMDRAVKRFVRVPASTGKAAPDQTQLQSGWRIVLISSRPNDKVLALEVRAPVIVGRREGDIVPQIDLTEYDATKMGVSRWHALMRPTQTGLFLTDLRSTNGTYYNSDRLEPAVAQELKNGDTIAFGQLVFKIRIVGGPESDD